MEGFTMSVELLNRSVGIILLFIAMYQYVRNNKQPSNFLVMVILL